MPGAQFLIVGDGELRGELEKQAHTLGIAESVRFLGFRSDLPRIYADLDCVVLCSKNEGLPVAIIEAKRGPTLRLLDKMYEEAQTALRRPAG